MENRYLLSDIVIDGIEPPEDWKELMERERRGELTPEEIEKIVRRPYQIPTDK
ncbi:MULTISPECIES: hypothetical protein [Bacillota]|jgi:hypothetical protein|uniref:hypothetical protein n=1 Tax=Bacillota TaxID=1239 RepID=UPI0013700E22|nr:MULTISPECIES: hypothetical protein [Bacillota]